MYKSVTGFFIALTINIFAVLVFAAESPVNMNHSLTGHNKVAGQNKVAGHKVAPGQNKTKESKETTLDYILHLENPGDTPLVDLSLSLVPRPPFVAKRTIVTVGYLGPHQSTDIKVQIVTPTAIDPGKFSLKPLSWAGKCLDAEGKLLEFPVKSRPGGAK